MAGWFDLKTAAEWEAQVGRQGMFFRFDHVFLGKWLAKIYDRVVKFATACDIIAQSTRPMVIEHALVSSSKVSHIILAAFLANLQISVPVQLGNFIDGDSGLTMQPINILRDDKF